MGPQNLRMTVNDTKSSHSIHTLPPDNFFSTMFTSWWNRIIWNKYYPYQFVIYDENVVARASFTLPISPQEMMINTPFAIQSTLTMGGYVEEHNAAPTRMIQLSGTTGVLPLDHRETNEIPSGVPIMGGMFQAVNNLVSNAKALFGVKTPPNLITNWVNGGTPHTYSNSGYVQFMLLREFLERYVLMKKDIKFRGYKLGLAIWKENTVYFVTPVSFNVRRSVSSPMEYLYDLQLRAFKRIHKDAIGVSEDVSLVSKVANPNAIQNALNKLRSARQVLGNASDVVRGVRSDITGITEIARQAILAAKDMMGVVQTAADMPAQLIKDIQRQIVPNLEQLRTSYDSMEKSVGNIFPSMKAALTELGNKTKVATHKAPQIAYPTALDHMIADPMAYSLMLEYIDPNTLKMPKSFYDEVARQTDQAVNKSKQEWHSDYVQVRTMALNVANTLGVGDATINALYGITEPIVNRTASYNEFLVLNALEDIADGIAVLAGIGPPDKLNTVEYIAGYAASSGIAFTTPVSKFAIPFVYGATLEQLASVYLKDPNRWGEIAALNGLREPYVDEVGFQISLLANGKLATVNVADITYLRTSQAVWLQSDTTPPVKRHILGIKQLGIDSYELSLDGDADLNIYRLADNAFLRAFLPDTVNSMQVIYIPSTQAGVTTEDLTAIPGVDAFDNLLQVSGIDLQLTQDNDLVISPLGDFLFSYGMNNIVQKVRLALATPKGSILQHPSFGLPISVGTSIADTSATDIASGIKNMFAGDPAFTGISGISVNTQGPSTKINVNINVYGLERPLDIGVQVTR